MTATDPGIETAPAGTGSEREASFIRHRDAVSGAFEISKRPNPLQRVTQVWQYRELLLNLTRKELRVKYKNSVLGFAWSLLNPALYLLVFSFVFSVVIGNGIRHYALFLMAGLVPWNFFQTTLTGGTGSIVANSSLVTKVWFPREVLPLANLLANLVHFLLQAIVLVAFLAAFRQAPSLSFMPLLVPAMVDLLLFSAALAIAFAAINVYLRDMSHLVELLALAWFWASPIVYSFLLIGDKLRAHGIPFLVGVLANPVTPVILTFQRVLYNDGLGWSASVAQHGTVTHTAGAVLPAGSIWWYGRNLLAIGLGSIVLLWIALVIFGRLEDNLAEEV